MFYTIDELQSKLENELNDCQELYVDYQHSAHAVITEMESGHNYISILCSYCPITEGQVDLEDEPAVKVDFKPLAFSMNLTFDLSTYSDSVLVTIEGTHKDKKILNTLRIKDDSVEYFDEDEDEDWDDEDDDETRKKKTKPSGGRGRILQAMEVITDMCRIKLMNIIGVDPDEFEYDDEDE